MRRNPLLRGVEAGGFGGEKFSGGGTSGAQCLGLSGGERGFEGVEHGREFTYPAR